MVASTDPGWIQSSFDTLTGLFEQVGLRTNVRNTVGMVCRPFRVDWVREYKAYTWKMTVDGRIFKDSQRERELCPKCGKELEKGSLVTHRQTQHGVAKAGLRLEGGEADGGNGGDYPRTYRLEFPVREGPRLCPVKGCIGRALTRTLMMVHVWHQHAKDTMVILEEGNLSHPRFPLCEIMVPWKDLNGTHRRTA